MRLKDDDELLLDEAPDYEEDEPEDEELEDDGGPADDDPKDEPKDDLPKRSDDELTSLRAKIAQAEEEREEARREGAKFRFEKEKAEYLAVKSHVERLDIEKKALRREVRDLERDVKEAEEAGDAAKHRLLQDRLDSIRDADTRVSGELTKFNAYLENNQPQEKAYEAPAKKTEKPADPEKNGAFEYWKEANSDWLNDPSHHDKLERAKALIKQYSGDYDIKSPRFWGFIDRELAKVEKPQRRAKPVLRGGTMESDGPKRKKESNAEALALTNQILRARGLTARDKETDEFKRISSSTYKTVMRKLQQQKKRG